MTEQERLNIIIDSQTKEIKRQEKIIDDLRYELKVHKRIYGSKSK